jgi:hypothetical protein
MYTAWFSGRAAARRGRAWSNPVQRILGPGTALALLLAFGLMPGAALAQPPPSEAGKLALAPFMVVQESGDGDAWMLIDEQTLAGDPRDGTAGQPSQAWISGTHGQMPASAYIDLGQEVDLTDIYLFDTSGNDTARDDEWVVSVGAPGSWTLVASESCDKHLAWKRHPVSVRTRYVRVTNRVAYVRMAEVVLYGSLETP